MNDLGVPGTQPVPLDEYNRIRAEAMASSRAS
jgi:hypothetical protein